jgi:hypothetical protein
MKHDAPLESAGEKNLHPCPACGIPYAIEEHDGGCPVCLLRQAMQTETAVQDDMADEGRFDHTSLCGAKTASSMNWAAGPWASLTRLSTQFCITLWR